MSHDDFSTHLVACYFKVSGYCLHGHAQCCAHNHLKMYCELVAKNCSTVYYFSRVF